MIMWKVQRERQSHPYASQEANLGRQALEVMYAEGCVSILAGKTWKRSLRNPKGPGDSKLHFLYSACKSPVVCLLGYM